MFPREIVDLIIDNLHDDIKTLLELSLVSMTISDSSRRHLLHSLTIKLEKLEVFLLECDTGSGSGRGSATFTKAAQSQCVASIATFKDHTRSFQLVCTAGVGKNGCWDSSLQAVGRIPCVLTNMKSLALVDFPFHRLHVALSLPDTSLSCLQTVLGFSVGREKDGEETMKAFHKIETLVLKSTNSFIHHEPLHILLYFLFPNVRKLVCQESDQQCSLLVPCATPPALPNDTIPLPRLSNLELLYPSKDIYTMLLHGPDYLGNAQNLSLALEDGPCFSGGFKSCDILDRVGRKLRCLRLNLDAAANDIESQPQLWDLSQNPNLTTLILHTRYNPGRRYLRCSAAHATWIIDLLNVIDPTRLRNLILLVEEENHGQTARGSNGDTSLPGALCDLGQCKNSSFLERLEEFWIMYKPACGSHVVNEGVIEGVPKLRVEEYILGLFCLDAMMIKTQGVVMPKVKVVKSVDAILDGFDLDPK